MAMPEDRHKETNDFLKDVHYDPFKDLADAFNGVDNDLEAEVKRLRAANRKLQTTLNQTERSLQELRKQVNLTCEEVLRIMRDGQEYGHIEDYTEKK